MIALLPASDRDPLATRVDRDGFKAVASWMVGKGLTGEREWGPVARAIHDLPLTDPEALHLQQIAYYASLPALQLDAIVQYIRFLQAAEGLTHCALWFAEIARDRLGVSGELLMELGGLYRKLCQWDEAEQAWSQLEGLGNEAWQVRAWIGRGMIARHRGNLSGVRGAEEWFTLAAAGAMNLPNTAERIHLRAMAVNNLGVTYSHMQPPQWEDAALKFYEASHLHQDEMLRWGSVANLAICAAGCHHYKLADLVLQFVIADSPCWADQTNALIERLDVCSALGDWDGVTFVRTQLRWRLDNLTPDMRVDHHYRLGLLELRRGASPATEWGHALYLANQHHLGEWIIRLETLLETPTCLQGPVEVARLEEVLVDYEVQAIQRGFITV